MMFLAESISHNVEHNIEKSVEMFRMGNEQEVNKFFINIIDGIDWLSQVLDMVLAAKEISPNTVFNGKSIGLLHSLFHIP